MSTKVFGARIYLDDHADPVTEGTNIGLYAITSNLASNAASGQADVIVADGTIFTAGEIVTVTDTADSEDAIILSIATNTLTMTANLTNAYTTARSAKVNANSRFRWVQNAISTVTTWKEGIIVAGGIRPYSREIDLSHGGNIASPGKSEVVVKNTNQFFDTIFDKGIYLNGLKCEIVLFTDATLAVQWTGTCENPTWDTREYSIPLSGYYSRRVANIGTIITEAGYPDASGDAVGKNIPVALGKFSIGQYAKFVRTANAVTSVMLNTGVKLSYTNATQYVWIRTLSNVAFDRSVFPVISAPSDLVYTLQVISTDETLLYSNYDGSTPTFPFTADVLVGKYLQVVEGNGLNQYRKITAASVTASATIQITIADFYTETLAGNATATATGQSWCSMVGVARDYTCDTWPCAGLLDSDGNATSVPVVCAYKEVLTANVTEENEPATVVVSPASFVRLPDYAYSKKVGASNNVLDLDIKLFNKNHDTIDSWIIVPVNDINRCSSSNLDKWGLLSCHKNSINGVYDTNAGSNISSVSEITAEQWTGNRLNQISGEYDGFGFQANAPGKGDSATFRVVFDVVMPEVDQSIIFDEAYLLTKIETRRTGGIYPAGGQDVYIYGDDFEASASILWRKFIGAAPDIFTSGSSFEGGYTGAVWSQMECLPDFYWSDAPTTNNEKFYVNFSGVVLNHLHYVWGFQNYLLTNIKNAVDLKSIKEMAIVYRHKTDVDSGVVGSGRVPFFFQVRIYGVAVGLKRTCDISESVFSRCFGRIYNDTWGTRVTAADPILNPHRILEHVCRLQNWSENSVTPTGGWGKGYAANALIKTGVADGSFDDATDGDYTTITGMECAAQLLTNDECYTDTIKRTICRDFFLANWTGADGYEKVKRIKRSTTATADALTLASIVDRQSIRIQEPTPNDIYPEPFVRYNKNPATGEYESAMRITNVSGTYAAASVEGLSGTDASTYWTRCNTLWKRCRHLNKPPTDLTDLTWANGAQADDIAKEYLTCWIDWMYNASITLKVPFAIAGAWEECHRFTINLPHQTNNVAIECMLTEITVDPNPPYYVTIRALMFNESIPEDLNIRKTLTAFGTDDGDWVKTLTAYSNDNDILKVT